MKRVDVYTEILIRRPVTEVAAYSSNPLNAAEWYANIKSVKLMPDDALSMKPHHVGVGSKIAFVANFLGRQLAYTYEVVEFVPDEKFVMRTSDGPFPMETTYMWTRISDTETRMSLRNRGVPSGFSKMVAPFMAGMMRMANRKDLKRLKFLLESVHA